MDLDNQILEMFKEKGMWIEFGAQFSAKGQIAQLLDVVKPLLKERDEALAKMAAMDSQTTDKPAVAVPDGWEVAQKVRAALDRSCCPDAYMRIAFEAVEQSFRDAASSHSQQSSFIIDKSTLTEWSSDLSIHGAGNTDCAKDIYELLGLGKCLRDRCPSHESEQYSCNICNGSKGGVKGNENVIDGKLVCDYCHAELTLNQQTEGE